MTDTPDHYAAAVRHLAAAEHERTPTDTERRQNHLSAAATHASLAATVIAERQAAAAEQSVAVNVRLLEVMAQSAPHPEVDDLREQLAVLRDLVGSLVDPDPCDLDHHGYCQPHGWTYTEPACPMARAAELGLIRDDEEDDRG